MSHSPSESHSFQTSKKGRWYCTGVCTAIVRMKCINHCLVYFRNAQAIFVSKIQPLYGALSLDIALKTYNVPSRGCFPPIFFEVNFFLGVVTARQQFSHRTSSATDIISLAKVCLCQERGRSTRPVGAANRVSAQTRDLPRRYPVILGRRCIRCFRITVVDATFRFGAVLCLPVQRGGSPPSKRCQRAEQSSGVSRLCAARASRRLVQRRRFKWNTKLCAAAQSASAGGARVVCLSLRC